MYNMPPVFPIYTANVVFQWIDAQEGIEEIQRVSQNRALKLYEAIDRSPHFENRVNASVCSDMNSPFFIITSDDVRDDAIDGTFLKFCEKRNLRNLKGFQSVGGDRASIYNAMSIERIDELVRAIDDFPRFAIEGVENRPFNFSESSKSAQGFA
jgi:phosphoserine aminotransferase